MPEHTSGQDGGHYKTESRLENSGSENIVGNVQTNKDDTASYVVESDLGSNHNVFNDNILKEPVVNSKLPIKNSKPTRVHFVSLFKKNRMANDNHKLEFFAPGTNRLKFSYDDIDSVEKTRGICLLGYVDSGKPPTFALLDLVHRWGKDVNFQTHAEVLSI